MASFIGLDDSHFQDVLDSMTPEEYEVAVEVNQQREREYAEFNRYRLDQPASVNSGSIDTSGALSETNVHALSNFEVESNENSTVVGGSVVTTEIQLENGRSVDHY